MLSIKRKAIVQTSAELIFFYIVLGDDNMLVM